MTQPEEPTLTAEEWAAIEKRRAARRNPKKPFNLSALFPTKLSETGSQLTYLGAIGLVGVGVIALGGDVMNVIPIDVSSAIAAFSALLFGGGGYRQLNKRHEANVDDSAVEDFGYLPDDDEYGPTRD